MQGHGPPPSQYGTLPNYLAQTLPKGFASTRKKSGNAVSRYVERQPLRASWIERAERGDRTAANTGSPRLSRDFMRNRQSTCSRFRGFVAAFFLLVLVGVSAGAVAVVEDAASRVEFIEHSLQTLARGNFDGVFRVGGGELLGEGRVAHVEEFARLIQLPAWFADVPVAREFDEDPLARLSGRSRPVRRQAEAVENVVLRQLHMGQVREGPHSGAV